jgi:hypothetical protein
VPNVPVLWQPSPGSALSLTNLVSISDANGLVSASAQLGSTPGATQRRCASPTRWRWRSSTWL